MRLSRFDYNVVYVPGKDLLISDALSRDPLESEAVHQDVLDELELNVSHVSCNSGYRSFR